MIRLEIVALVVLVSASCGDPRGQSGQQPVPQRPVAAEAAPAVAAAAFLEAGAERRLVSAPFQSSVLSIIGQGSPVNVLTFQRFSAELRMKGHEAQSLSLVVQMGSGAGNDPGALQRLTDKRALDAKAHPEARFVAEDLDAGPGEISIKGTLHVRGKALPVTVPARLEVKPGGVELRAELTLPAQAWREVATAAPKDLGDRFQLISKLWFPFPGSGDGAPSTAR